MYSIPRKALLVVLFSFFYIIVSGQMAGTYTVPGSFPTIGSAISSLNNNGISAPVTILVMAGHTETAIVGGYELTATGTSANHIKFIKAGTGQNPMITAFATGTALPNYNYPDIIWRFIGSDYVTIDGIDLAENPLNTSYTQYMEYGFAFYPLNSANGCQNNEVKNCTITLDKLNNYANGAISGSTGIYFCSSLYGNPFFPLSRILSSASNSYNKIYSNTVQNCFIPIVFTGYNASGNVSLGDVNNDIGGSLPSTGNHLYNFGSFGPTCYGIYVSNQWDFNASYNVINNNTGAGLDHQGIITGLLVNPAKSSNCTLNSNTITIHKAGNGDFGAIENQSGSSGFTNTVNINNNLIINCTTSTLSSNFYGIKNYNNSPAYLNINGNCFTGNSTNSSSAGQILIFNSGGSATNSLSICNNTLSFTFNNACSGNFSGITSNASSTTCVNSISNNYFTAINHNSNSTNDLSYIVDNGSSAELFIENNTWDNLINKSSGAHYLIKNGAAVSNSLSVSSNSVIGGYTINNSGTVTAFYGLLNQNNSYCNAEFVVKNNNFSNVSTNAVAGGNFYGLLVQSGGFGAQYPRLLCFNNIVSNITFAGSVRGMCLYYSGSNSAGLGSAIYSNTVTNISCNNLFHGIVISSSTANVINKVFLNTVSNISSGNSTQTYAIHVQATKYDIYKNKIYDITRNGLFGTTRGLICDGTNINTYNNLIGNLYAPFCSDSLALTGIVVSGIVSLKYNTVYINATSTGNNFGTAALYDEFGTTIDLRNNIFVNTSVPTGTESTIAFRRKGSSLMTWGYNQTCNNNLFYAGTPGSNRLIARNPAFSYQTLGAFKTAVAPMEAASVTELPPFSTTVGANANFLNINTSFTTQVESGAVVIAGINDDYAGNARNNVTPDIGAWEGIFMNSPCTSVNAGTISPATATMCNGGTVSIGASGFNTGGTMSYQWKYALASAGPYSVVTSGTGSNTPTYNSANLTTGTYYFLFEAICNSASLTAASNIVTVTVNSTPVPTVSATSNSSICSGQLLTLGGASNNGTAFLWQGPANYTSTTANATIVAQPSVAGTYTFCASVPGCTSVPAFVSVSVSPTPMPFISSSSSVVCLGNNVTLAANGGASFSWNNGANSSVITITPSISFGYTVTASANNCTASATASVIVKPNPTVNVVTSPNSYCLGGQATLTANGANSYTWSTNQSVNPITANPTITTVYYVVGTSTNNCTDSAAKTLIVNAPPNIVAVTSNSLLCVSQSATLTASGAANYTWNPGGPGASIVVSPTVISTYTVAGVDGNGCINWSVITQSVSNCTYAEQSFFTEGDLRIYPNPFSGAIIVELSQNATADSIELYSATGSMISSILSDGVRTCIDLSAYSDGIYFLRISRPNGFLVKKIIKNQ